MNFEIMREKIRNQAYNNPLPYPSHSEKPPEPRILKDSKYYENVMVEYNQTREEYQKRYQAYREMENTKNKEFMGDMIASCIAEGARPKQAELIYDIAWDRGHSNGREAVISEAETLLTLINAK